MTVSQKEWKGCFCAIVTPFKKNGEIDYELFCINIELLVKEGQGVPLTPGIGGGGVKPLGGSPVTIPPSVSGVKGKGNL